MSSTLVWRPIVKEGEPLSDQLKHALQRKYQDSVYKETLGWDDMSYIDGLIDAGITNAADLKRAIEQHDLIEVEEVW